MKTTFMKHRSQAPIQQLIHRVGVRNLIIFTPLLIATVFSLGFMQTRVNYTQQQAARSRQQTVQNSRSSTAASLPLITQPELPVISDNLPPTPATEKPEPVTNQKTSTTIGPSSKGAAKALQGVTNGLGDSMNDGLQATRKQIKLDELDL